MRGEEEIGTSGVVGKRASIDDSSAERAWMRLQGASSFGDCLVTIATGEIEASEADRLGLVPT